MRSSRVLFLTLLSAMLVAGAAVGQTQQRTPNTGLQQQGGNGASPFPGRNEGEEPGSAAMRETQAKARNDERQKRLVSDTDKLLALATQLHADVAKTDRNILSLDVVRRCEELEKLAHAIKERMKN